MAILVSHGKVGLGYSGGSSNLGYKHNSQIKAKSIFNACLHDVFAKYKKHEMTKRKFH